MVVVKSRLFASDEELGKRDDDHRPRKMVPVWNVKHRPFVSKRQIFGALVAVILLFFFIRNLPEGTGPKLPRPNPFGIKPQTAPNRVLTKEEIQEVVNGYPRPVEPVQPDVQPVPNDPKDSDQPPPAPPPSSKRTYDGPIRFYHLASSLHASERTSNTRVMNKNVVFTASDLRSVAALLPIACEMSRWNRNSVHMAVMGRDEMKIEDIRRVNGAEKDVCDISWHDARPDYASTSTDSRMEVSVGGALQHIKNFMRPQVLITVDPGHEETFFNTGLHQKANMLEIPIVQVPAESPELLSWIARLDATSLNSWHIANIDILIQVPLGPSGSLIRLLKSLDRADYTGFAVPRLTIELPPDVDGPTTQFLSRFQWPPKAYYKPGDSRLLSIRRRISTRRLDADEASVRFIESFYPHNPHTSHVLLLSPQAELSPIFFHYLKLHLLEYRLSASAPGRYDDLLGISLHTPSMHLNGSGPLEIPLPQAGSTQAEAIVPFRWQAPNSKAALYFGDKWMEIHSFLTKRDMAAHHDLTKDHHQNKKKLVSRQSPAYIEYLLDLMRVRGYYMHYPGHKSGKDTPVTEQSLVTIHNELYQPPEEYPNEPLTVENADESPELPGEDDVLTVPDQDSYLASHKQGSSSQRALDSEHPLMRSLTSLLEQFDPSQPHDDPDIRYSGRKSQLAMPSLINLPLLDNFGSVTTEEDMDMKAEKILLGYRRLAGGCSERQAEDQKLVPQSANDLFCLEDDAEEEPVSATTPLKTPSRDGTGGHEDYPSPRLGQHENGHNQIATEPREPEVKTSKPQSAESAKKEEFPQLKAPKAPEEAIRNPETVPGANHDADTRAGDNAAHPRSRPDTLPADHINLAPVQRLKPASEPVEDTDVEDSATAAALGAKGKKSEKVEIPVQDAHDTHEAKSWRQSQAKEAAAAAGKPAAQPKKAKNDGGKLTPAERWGRPHAAFESIKHPKPHPVAEDEHEDEFLRLASNVKQQEAVRRPQAGEGGNRQQVYPDAEEQEMLRHTGTRRPEQEQEADWSSDEPEPEEPEQEEPESEEDEEVLEVGTVPDAEEEADDREFAHRPWAPIEADRERLMRQREKQRAALGPEVIEEEEVIEEPPPPEPAPVKLDPATLRWHQEMKQAADAADAARKEMDQ